MLQIYMSGEELFLGIILFSSTRVNCSMSAVTMSRGNDITRTDVRCEGKRLILDTAMKYVIAIALN
ncbi:hypothetical protein OK016_04410 [Vibrio chagasii]|nr:hypothetical protein [Vibrio chagasii]